MKCMTLAVAILLVVGCQAAPMQADAPVPLPEYLHQARIFLRMYLDQIKEASDRITERITDPVTKDAVKSKLDEISTKIKTLQAHVGPVTDGAVATVDDATRDFRTSIYSDIDVLRKELEPMRTALDEAVTRHWDEYRLILQPIIDDYRTTQEAQIAALKARLELVVDDLRDKIKVNVEETKTKLLPIIAVIRSKVSERLEQIRAAVDPYVQEYRDQGKAIITQAQSIDPTEVREKVQPHIDTISTNVQALIKEIQGMAAK